MTEEHSDTTANGTDAQVMENGTAEKKENGDSSEKSVTIASSHDENNNNISLRRKLSRHQSSGMESSVFRFKDIDFVVDQGKRKEKSILQDVSGTVKWGHVLAIMGPSGAGKTTLISALTQDAFFGTSQGSVTLNGVNMSDDIFKRHCYVVKQQDKHWPYLTARETLSYAAELYDVADKSDIAAIVDEIVEKMGLQTCIDTRCARLSGGQRRRLSIAVALLKQPTLLFLDEPTSGLDAAAASSIMQEIIRVAKDERIIIVCTIHQPSTKVYNGFDQVMILSKGREAFAGNVQDAIPYFETVGYPLPPAMNPAEHFLDLVNADFSSGEEVDRILDHWEQCKPEAGSMHGKEELKEDDEQEGVASAQRSSPLAELLIMFRRHFQLVIRDPILYLGRCLIFLIANTVFAFVYWNARDYSQDQAANKLWLVIWFVGVPSNMGVVAVYALNDEFKSIQRETKNGMVSPLSYILAKTVLVIPIMFIFSLFALGIPAYVIQDYPPSSFGVSILLWSCLIYVIECVAEMLAVVFDDPIMGMLQFLNFWFASFLFGGFLISLDDLYWPLKLFYYVMPYSYYVRSTMYNLFTNADWEPCFDKENEAVCTNSTAGEDVLDELSKVYPLLTSDNNVAQDIGILIAIAMFYKVISVVGIIVKSRKVSKIQSV